MKNKSISYFLVLLGVILLAIGLFLVKTNIETQGFMQAVPYICIGLGCGIFGQGMGSFISQKAIKNNPNIEKELEININDERNIAISNRAKAKAYDMMIFVFGALILSFGLMGADTIFVLLLVFAYLLIVGYGIYFRCKFDKEM